LAHSLLIDKRGRILTQSQTAERIIEQEFHKLERQREFLEKERQWKIKKQKREIQLHKEFQEKKERVRRMRHQKRLSLDRSSGAGASLRRSHELENSPPKILDNGMYNSYDLVEHFMSEEMDKMQQQQHRKRPVSRQKRKTTANSAPRSSKINKRSHGARKPISASYNSKSILPLHNTLITSNHARVSVDDIHEWNHIIGKTDSSDSLPHHHINVEEIATIPAPTMNPKSSRFKRQFSNDLEESTRKSLPSLDPRDNDSLKSAERKRATTGRKRSVKKHAPRRKIQSSKVRTKLYNHISQQPPNDPDNETPHQEKLQKLKMTPKRKNIQSREAFVDETPTTAESDFVVHERSQETTLPEVNQSGGKSITSMDTASVDVQEPKGPLTALESQFPSEQDQHKAAITIQSQYRSFEAKKRLTQKKEEKQAAVKIQSHYRGFLSRRELEIRRKEREATQKDKEQHPEQSDDEVDLDVFDEDFEDFDMEVASTTEKLKENSARTSEPSLEGQSEDVEQRTFPTKEEESQAAIKIQRNMRVKLAKNQLQQKRLQNEAASVIQRNLRGKFARDDLAKRKQEHAAAVAIQRSARGRLARRRVEEMRKSVPPTAGTTEPEYEKETNQFEVDFEQEVAQQLDDFEQDIDEDTFVLDEDSYDQEEVLTSDPLEVKKESKPEITTDPNLLLRKEDDAAIVIQRNVRKKLAQKEAQTRREKHEAATKIQRNVRKRIAQKGVQLRRHEHKSLTEKKEQEAATVIQRNVRRRRAQLELQSRKVKNDAAIMIQRNARGRLARRKVQTKRDATHAPSEQRAPTETKNQDQAAAIIQRNVRRRLAQKELESRREKHRSDADTTQPKLAVKENKIENDSSNDQIDTDSKAPINEEEAALILQCNARKMIAKNQLQKRKESHEQWLEAEQKREQSAIVIQRNMRKRLAQKEVQSKRDEKQQSLEKSHREREQSAIVIQRNMRKTLAQKEARSRREQREAAIKIQRNARVKLARNTAEQRRKEAEQNQSTPSTQHKNENENVTKEIVRTDTHCDESDSQHQDTPVKTPNIDSSVLISSSAYQDKYHTNNDGKSKELNDPAPAQSKVNGTSSAEKEAISTNASAQPPAPKSSATLTIVDEKRKDSNSTQPSFMGGLHDLNFSDLEEMEHEEAKQTMTTTLVESEELIPLDDDDFDDEFEESIAPAALSIKKTKSKDIFDADFDDLDEDLDFDVELKNSDVDFEDEFMDEEDTFFG